MATPSKIDYLDVDPAIAGQNFVCLSFVASPEEVMQEKALFVASHFLEHLAEHGLQLPESLATAEKRKEAWDIFIHHKEKDLQDQFAAKHVGRNTCYGCKVRGTYQTLDEAKARAQTLQKIDPDFHVYVGQVGYWLPWYPKGHQVGDEVFAEQDLQNIVKGYKENLRMAEEFYRTQTQERLEMARKEGQAGREGGAGPSAPRLGAEAAPAAADGSGGEATATELMESMKVQ